MMPLAASATPLYTVTVLQPVDGFQSVATSVNNAGKIVGYSAGAQGSFATEWSPSGIPLADQLALLYRPALSRSVDG